MESIWANTEQVSASADQLGTAASSIDEQSRLARGAAEAALSVGGDGLMRDAAADIATFARSLDIGASSTRQLQARADRIVADLTTQRSVVWAGKAQ